MSERVSLPQAAQEIGCNVEFLRRQMRRKDKGRWDLGEVVPPDVPGGNYQYLIFRAKLDALLGKKENHMEYETYSIVRCRNTGFVFREGDTVTVVLKNGGEINDCMIIDIIEDGFLYRQGKKNEKIKYEDIAEVKHYLKGKETS